MGNVISMQKYLDDQMDVSDREEWLLDYLTGLLEFDKMDTIDAYIQTCPEFTGVGVQEWLDI